MKLRTARSVSALTIAAALLLSACGDSGKNEETPSATPSGTPTAAATASAADVAALDAVTVNGAAGTESTLEFTTPFTVSAETLRVLDEGTGEDIVDGSLVGIQLVPYNGTDGTLLGESTWATGPTEAEMNGSDLPVTIQNALVGHKVGTRVLYAQPTTDQTTGAPSTSLFIIDAVSTRPVPTRATGEAVTPPEGLPTVTLDDTGKPSITIPEGYVVPDELVAQTLIKGDGPVITQGQTVQFHYTGWKASDGTQFDSSWDKGTPFVSAIGTGAVIAGWDQGLVGQTVGSQVLLVIPRSLAYGVEGSTHALKDEDLIFVVDILRAA